MKTAEYTVSEMQTLLDSMSGMYDLVRVVDPSECRVLDFDQDGRLSSSERCYGVWESDQRCAHCSSAAACQTGCHQTKNEKFQDQVFHIQSNPVKLKLTDGGLFDAVVELISIDGDKAAAEAGTANDREAENVESGGIRYLANHDSLTGTLKAEIFSEFARELLMQSPDEQWIMVIGDIVEFRLINSLFGIERGNEVLMMAADRLRTIAEERSGLCGRLYGDKFAVLLPGKSYSEAIFNQAAKELNEAFSSGVYSLCVHFGIYEISDTSLPISVMCDRANMAVKEIHDDFSITVAYFDDEIMEKSLAEYEVISSFETALKEGQFKMFLQPLTDRDGKPFGAEALARWIQPDGTVVTPDKFINTIEQANLIQELDKYIWEKAARQLSRWKGTEMDGLAISVNMSAKDLYCMDVYEIMTGLVNKYGIDAAKLRVEITESALVENPEKSYLIIRKLRQAGFVVEIDDFGKGESSLSLLKDIHADILKIDREFLRETENASRSKIILRSVIAMAGDLGMQVIVEGVETEGQLDTLTEMGCRCFQGYYFSRPVAIEEFEKKYGQMH